MASEGGFPGKDIVNRPIPELHHLPGPNVLFADQEGPGEGVAGLLLAAALERVDGRMNNEMFNSLCGTICDQVREQGNS